MNSLSGLKVGNVGKIQGFGWIGMELNFLKLAMTSTLYTY